MGRTHIDRLLRELYDARSSGDLEGVCRVFAPDAKFQIAGASETGPAGIKANGIREFRPLLAFMIKTFKLGALIIRTMEIQEDQATVRWQADVQSRITGATVPTELIDVVEVRDGKIVNYNEVFMPR
jgi:ketosteroid isomerase-like protein